MIVGQLAVTIIKVGQPVLQILNTLPAFCPKHCPEISTPHPNYHSNIVQDPRGRDTEAYVREAKNK